MSKSQTTTSGPAVFAPSGDIMPSNRPPTHPGEILQEEFLVPLELSQSEFARRIGVSYVRINDIIHGRRVITVDTATRIAQFFGTSVQFWLNLQQNWELWHFLKSDAFKEIRAGIRPMMADRSNATKNAKR
jgi:antitoxin HigA-1